MRHLPSPLNGLEQTQRCIERLYRTAGYPFAHFVVDSGSPDGTWEWLTRMSQRIHPHHIDLHRIDVKQGISAAADRALSEMRQTYDIIGKVDGDAILLSEGWLNAIVDVWKRNHLLASSPRAQDRKAHIGDGRRVASGQVNGEPVSITRHVDRPCVFADRRAWQACRLAETDTLHGTREDDFSRHLREYGFYPAVLENSIVERAEQTA